MQARLECELLKFNKCELLRATEKKDKGWKERGERYEMVGEVKTNKEEIRDRREQKGDDIGPERSKE